MAFVTSVGENIGMGPSCIIFAIGGPYSAAQFPILPIGKAISAARVYVVLFFFFFDVVILRAVRVCMPLCDVHLVTVETCQVSLKDKNFNMSET